MWQGRRGAPLLSKTPRTHCVPFLFSPPTLSLSGPDSLGDFVATNRATSFPIPLKMELSAYIECRSWSRKITFNSCWSNARNAASAFFAKTKDRFGLPLPEPRNAIFRVLYNKNRPVSGDMESLEQLLIST